jgi:quercetin dioxygenase-like cupin family protein
VTNAATSADAAAGGTPPVTIVRGNAVPRDDYGWGTLQWLANSRLAPGSLQTFGVSTIGPGQGNPLHYHPNCEEILYVVAGRCTHTYDGAAVDLATGDVIVIPAGVRHNLKNTGDTDVVCVISFSSADRETVFLE